MKNLFSVLLVATLAIASSVAAQEPQQVFVMDSVPEVPSMVSQTTGALWDKQYPHDKFRKCPKPLVITFPIPECEYERKNKCKVCARGCDLACDAGKGKCKDKCGLGWDQCNRNCTNVDTCKENCKVDETVVCAPCINLACETVCIAQGPPGPGLAGRCRAACNQNRDATPAACEVCSDDCHHACDDSKYACEDACDSGAYVCKDKCKDNEQKCESECKPCEEECNMACQVDQWGCISDCKQYIGSDLHCFSKCKRDCPSICERSCKRCEVKADGAHGPDGYATDATVSEEVQAIAAAPELSATDATVSEEVQAIAAAPAAP
ncbi:hypothetical protein BGZ82_003055 [Podila clonocystis]|nr:hypothetical protein BGZ82_003055 [Podila clonocystis]